MWNDRPIEAFLPGAFGSWLFGQLASAARTRLGERLLGSEQERALLTAGQAAIVRAARELRPVDSEHEVEHVAAVLDEVFEARMPDHLLDDHSTMLEALQAAVATQLTVLGDPTLSGAGMSSADALGLPLEGITEALIRSVVREIVARGAGGGPLAPLAAQLDHDLTHLQGRRIAGTLARIVEQLSALGSLSPPLPLPRELPRPIVDFTGRENELLSLQALLASPPTGAPRPVIAIDGMGGIGKSALALQVAHNLADADAFPDGQLYVNLQGATPGSPSLDPLEALGQMLRSLGVEPAQIPSELEEAAVRFRSLAASRCLLVVLDNAATPEQVRPLLPASPTCGVLVTSRQVLAALEGTRSLHLDALPHDRALELLARIAGQERLETGPDAAADVVRCCGCLPLAIRIAGARLVARPGWTTKVLAARLADATHRLEELQVGELAVRASFDVSLDALQQSRDSLDQEAAAVFGLLSLPDGPDLGVAAAARLIDEPESSAQRLLERLVDVQLLEAPRPDRYQFHDLVRVYARSHARVRYPERERHAALTRLWTFFTATARDTGALLQPSHRRLAAADDRRTGGSLAFPDVPALLAWFEAERANLRAAIPQIATLTPAVPADLAIQLTEALFGLLSARGYWKEGIRANQTALELAGHTGDRTAQARAHNGLGSLYWKLGHYEEAIASYGKSCALFEELGDRRGVGNSLNGLGNVYSSRGHHREAIEHYEDCLAIFRELGDRRGEAYGLHNLGAAYAGLGRYPEAITRQQESLAVFRELGDRRGEALSLSGLSHTYGWLERYPEGITCGQDSLAIFREVGDRHGEAYGLSSLGFVYSRLGRYSEAITHEQESLVIFRELGDRHSEAYSLSSLGFVYARLGRHSEAITHEQDSLAIFRELGDRTGEARSLSSLGFAYARVAQYSEAIANEQDSLVIFRELGDRHGQVETLRDLGDALRAVGRNAEAEAGWREALAICEALQIPEADEIRNRLAEEARQ